jgi:sulfate transport system ATP-binding protein
VLLLDEPFGALDAKVRQELRRWLRSLHDELQITSVFVTHDQEEALELADRVVVMNAGRIEQVGKSDEVYRHPATAFVYNFLGNVNLFHGRVEGGRVYLGDTALEVDPRFSSENGAMKSPAGVGVPQNQTEAHSNGKDDRALMYVRPHLLDIDLGPSGLGPSGLGPDGAGPNGSANHFPATVLRINPAGPLVKVELRAPWGDIVQVEMGHERFEALGLVAGAQVYVRPREARVFIYQI